MRIDCTDCQMYRSEHCDDCLVTALVRPEGPVEIDETLAVGLGALSQAGLVPVLKFRPRPAPQGPPHEGPQTEDVRSA